VAVVLTVTAPGPAALAELWARLGGHRAQVDIVGDDISIHVDLTPPEAVAEDLAAQDAAEAEAAEADVVSIDRNARANHPTSTIRPDTAGDRVLAVLASDPTSTFTPADLAEQLPDIAYGTLTGQLATLVRTGKVRRRGRGQYQAV
jgi:hypothetical protein